MAAAAAASVVLRRMYQYQQTRRRSIAILSMAKCPIMSEISQPSQYQQEQQNDDIPGPSRAYIVQDASEQYDEMDLDIEECKPFHIIIESHHRKGPSKIVSTLHNSQPSQYQQEQQNDIPRPSRAYFVQDASEQYDEMDLDIEECKPFHMDSGAANHSTCDRSLWNDYQPPQEAPVDRLIGVGGPVQVEGIGYIANQQMELHGVLLAPKSGFNLVSVSQLTRMYRVKVELYPDYFHIADRRSGRRVGGGRRCQVSNLYVRESFESAGLLLADRME